MWNPGCREASFSVFSRSRSTTGFTKPSPDSSSMKPASWCRTEAGSSAGWMTSRSGRGLIPWGRLGEVALVSSDRAVRIFAKTIPYPITAYDGVCKVSLELADHLGDRFVASGAGFPPGDEVVTELRFYGPHAYPVGAPDFSRGPANAGTSSHTGLSVPTAAPAIQSRPDLARFRSSTIGGSRLSIGTKETRIPCSSVVRG